jgi:hypothetical protein
MTHRSLERLSLGLAVVALSVLSSKLEAGDPPDAWRPTPAPMPHPALPDAGPEAQPNVPKNRRNRPLQLRVNPKVSNDNPCDFDAEPLGQACENRRTIAAEQALLRGVEATRTRRPKDSGAEGRGDGSGLALRGCVVDVNMRGLSAGRKWPAPSHHDFT